MTGRALRRVVVALVALAAVASLNACATVAVVGPDETVPADRKLRVLATANFIADTARRIGGPDAEVQALMGPGVDPHLYKASAGDVRDLARADVILYGGLELEGRMADAFEETARTRRTVAVTRDIPRSRLRAEAGAPDVVDPHVWFDVELWSIAARTIARTFVDADPAHADGYRARLRAVLADFAALDREVRARIATIPAGRRVLVTSHDAFAYFGARYGMDVVAIQGISTAAEATTADIRRVADVLVRRRVGAVFVESSTPRATIDAVRAAAARRGQRVTVGDELYADAAGDDGSYEGMVRANAQRIQAALGGAR